MTDSNALHELDPNVARFTILEPALVAHKLVSLVEGLESRGLMSQFGEGSTVADLASAAGFDVSMAQAIVGALESGDVLEGNGDGYRLTPAWRGVLSEHGFTPFAAIARGARTTGRLLREVGAGGDYWSVDAADRLALAASVSPDPFVGGFTRMVRRNAEEGHRFASATRDARRYLELGCGLAGSGLSGVVAFPGIHMVGVELSDDLAAEAERRAEALGVADRVTIVRSDAADFHDPEPFDVGFWSQFFFPEQSRASALRTLFTHVRSGGTVAAPGRYCEPGARVPASVSQDYALFRVSAQSWGVPERSPEQVAAEFETAGFESTEIFENGPARFMVVATRP